MHHAMAVISSDVRRGQPYPESFPRSSSPRPTVCFYRAMKVWDVFVFVDYASPLSLAVCLSAWVFGSLYLCLCVFLTVISISPSLSTSLSLSHSLGVALAPHIGLYNVKCSAHTVAICPAVTSHCRRYYHDIQRQDGMRTNLWAELDHGLYRYVYRVDGAGHRALEYHPWSMWSRVLWFHSLHCLFLFRIIVTVGCKLLNTTFIYLWLRTHGSRQDTFIQMRISAWGWRAIRPQPLWL